jgi:hypothetical protein
MLRARRDPGKAAQAAFDVLPYDALNYFGLP